MNIYNRPKRLSTKKNILISEAELEALKRGIPKKNFTPKKEKCIDLPGEEWKEIPNTLSLYQVSNLGRLRKFKCCDRHGNNYYVVLTPRPENGLLRHRLYVGGFTKNIFIHKEVKQAFDPTEEKLIVFHLDSNPLNNRIENLGYRKKNKPKTVGKLKTIDYLSKSGLIKTKRSKVSIGDIEDIQKMLQAGIPQKLVAEQFGISSSYANYLKRLSVRKVNGKAYTFVKSIHE